MVFEDIITIRFAERHPWEMLPIAFFFSTIAIWLALWVFPGQASMVAVFLTTLAGMPIMISLIQHEAEKEAHSNNYILGLLKGNWRNEREHERLLPFFVYLFLGMALAYTFWFAILPTSTVQSLFSVQLGTIKQINQAISSGATIGAATSAGFFIKILANNVKVLAFAIFFSFIYGAGAIFVLAWNASVIGVAMGESIRRGLEASVGFIGYSSVVSTSLMRYMLHGIPEILAYFVGGLAGGIVSVALLKHKGGDKFDKTMKDAFVLIAVAIGILIVAALIEVNLSPMIPIS